MAAEFGWAGGLFNATRAVRDQMKAQGGGHIVGIAPGSSIRGFKNEVAYCTIKHAQEEFVKALAIEAAPYQIALNTVSPSTPIKPARLPWEELEATPARVKSGWADLVELGKAFVWLAAHSLIRFSGFRFDAGGIVRAIEAEGYDFPVTPEKVTLYTVDFRERQEWYARNMD